MFKAAAQVDSAATFNAVFCNTLTFLSGRLKDPEALKDMSLLSVSYESITRLDPTMVVQKLHDLNALANYETYLIEGDNSFLDTLNLSQIDQQIQDNSKVVGSWITLMSAIQGLWRVSGPDDKQKMWDFIIDLYSSYLNYVISLHN